MRTKIIAAVAALGLASGVASARDGEGPAAATPASTQTVPSIATAQHGPADTQPGHSPWIFPPIGKYLDQHAG